YRDGRLLVDQRQQFIASASFADINNRHRTGDRQDLLAQSLHQQFGFLTLLLASQILDRDPMLQLRRLDHIKQSDATAGMRRAARGIMDGDLEFLGLIDNYEEDARVRGLVHRPDPLLGPPSKAQAPLNGKLASHPATMAVSTAIAP